MRCRNCAHELPAGTKFCPECGQDQGVLFAPQERIQTPSAAPQPNPPDDAGSWVGRGVAGGIGACVVLPVLLFLVLVVLPFVLMVACGVVVGDSP